MKCIKFLSIMLAAAAVMAACTKDPEQKPDDKTNPSSDPGQPSGATPTVTISADASFNADMKATVTLTLSAKSDNAVKVKLAKADIQSGKQEIPADFTKNITIAAGETTATVEVEADALGLESGDYQAAIKIASAEGATVGEPAVVYIAYSYTFKPEVNLYADGQFASTKKASLKIALAKAAPADVKVKLAVDPESKAEVSFDKEVTIPAGETEKTIDVTVTVPDDLESGIYPVIIKIENAENAEIGKSPSVTINLAYPFSVDITIDGVFDDWNDPSITSWVLPADALFKDVLEMKLAASTQYVYMYLEFVDPGFEVGRPIDIFINADGDNSTGCYLHTIDNAGDYAFIKPWNDPGIEWYLEGALQYGYDDEAGNRVEGFYDFTGLSYFMRYGGADGDYFWSVAYINKTSELAGSPTIIYNLGELKDGIGRIECQISRKHFDITGSKAALGFKLMNGADDWKALGLAPQVGSPSAPTYTAGEEMLTVYLPPYAE